MRSAEGYGLRRTGIGLIDNLLADPGLKYITGFASKAPIIQGRAKLAPMRWLSRSKGRRSSVRSSLSRGAGAITETEGKRRPLRLLA